MLLFDKKFLLDDNDKKMTIAEAISRPDEIAESEQVSEKPAVWLTNSKTYHVQGSNGEWTPEFVEQVPPHVAQFLTRGYTKMLPETETEEFARACSAEFDQLGVQVTMLFKIPDAWFQHFFVANPLVASALDMLFESRWKVSSCVAKKCGLSPIGWHRDYPYTFESEPAKEGLLGVQIVVLLDEATELNGATEYLEGSHKNEWGWSSGGRLKQFCGPPGTIIMYHAALWHRSGTNFIDAKTSRNMILLNIVAEQVAAKDLPINVD